MDPTPSLKVHCRRRLSILIFNDPICRCYMVIMNWYSLSQRTTSRRAVSLTCLIPRPLTILSIWTNHSTIDIAIAKQAQAAKSTVQVRMRLTFNHPSRSSVDRPLDESSTIAWILGATAGTKRRWLAASSVPAVYQRKDVELPEPDRRAKILYPPPVMVMARRPRTRIVPGTKKTLK